MWQIVNMILDVRDEKVIFTELKIDVKRNVGCVDCVS